MITNTGKDKIKWENVDYYKSVFSHEMKKYFFEDCPVFFDLNEVTRIYNQLGEEETLHHFKEYVRMDTLKVYGVKHPEARAIVNFNKASDKAMEKAAEMWENF